MREMGKQKAVALRTKRSEGVGGRSSKHRGRLRKSAATCRNKWQQKWLKKHNGKTLNVHHGLMAWRPGAKHKSKNLPRCSKKFEHFNWLLKMIKVKIGGKKFIKK
jgi:hypothetical protein